MRKFLVLFMFIFIGFTAANAGTLDSIGIKVIDGKSFIQYKVEKGESVYSIAKKYKVTIQDIIDTNPEVANGLKADAVILIPYTPPEDNRTTHHIVLSGETLYKIANKHNITVAQLKKWNNIKGDNINIGQRLRVIPPERIEQPKPVEKPKPEPPKPIIEEQKPKDTIPTIYIEQEEMVDVLPLDTNKAKQDEFERQRKLEEEAKERARMDSIAKVLAPKEFDEEAEMDSVEFDVVDLDYESNKIKLPSGETIDNGGCEIISDPNVEQNRNFCLHPDAPIGTIILVTNPDNGRSVFVRVVGNYEPEVANYVIIRITKEAAKKIGANGQYFQVNLSYTE